MRLHIGKSFNSLKLTDYLEKDELLGYIFNDGDFSAKLTSILWISYVHFYDSTLTLVKTHRKSCHTLRLTEMQILCSLRR